MSMLARVAMYFLKPEYSVAETFGLAVICGAFDLSEWWIGIPLIVLWLAGCRALASKAGIA